MRVVEKCVQSHFKALEVARVLKQFFVVSWLPYSSINDLQIPSTCCFSVQLCDFDLCEDLTEQEALLDAAELYHHATLSE